LLEYIPMPAFLYDVATLRYLAVNSAALLVYGYSREEFLAMRVPELQAPEDVERLLGVLVDLPPGQQRHGVWRHRKRDGTIFSVEISAQQVMDGDRRARLVMATDVTEQQQTAERLRESEARFRTFFEASPDGITLSNVVTGELLSVNPAFCRLCGWSEAELIGRSTPDLGLWRDPQDREVLVAALRRDGYVTNVEANLKTKEGAAIVALISSRTIDLAGQTRLLTIFREVTDVINAAAERDRLLEQLRQAQKMEAVGELAGGVAHDFNNLMTAVLGFADFLIADSTLPAQARDDVEQIRRAADRATGLTRQLLQFSRRQVMQPKLVDANRQLIDLEKMLRRLIGENIELTAQLAPGPLTLKVDPVQLEQVLVNLAVNARDAMPNGGRIALATDRVTLDAPQGELPAGDYISFSVTDSGQGMSEETQRRCFEPFFTTKAGRGTGLGLATVYGIVKQSGGTIAVTSALEHGTTFRILLPATQATALAPEAKGGAPQPGGSEVILVVEDDKLVRDTVCAVLGRSGFRVLSADGGAQARQVALAEPGHIDLLLSDVVMPHQDGLSVAKELLSLRPGLRVLFMSGYAETAVLQNGVLVPGIELIEKPFTPRALVEKVRGVLSRPQSPLR